MATIFAFLLGLLLGLLTFIGYGAHRAVGSAGWDDSNILNWLRLLSHVVMHPEDFAHMYYLSGNDWYVVDGSGRRLPDKDYRPFDYISKDEFSENFPESRP